MWGCGVMPRCLTGHVAGGLAESLSPSCCAWRCSWWQRAAPGSLAHRQAVLRSTEAVSLHAINLLLGLPNMPSQLLVADIFQLLMWNSCWGPTAKLCVCVWAVLWEQTDKIAFFPILCVIILQRLGLLAGVTGNVSVTGCPQTSTSVCSVSASVVVLH